MHRWAKEILECVRIKVESIGVENFEGQNLDDLKDWTEIAKNIVRFDKDYQIVEAMKKAEDNEEIIQMIERYEDYPSKRYYDDYRYKNGKFAPKGHGGRRGYSETFLPYDDMYMWDRDIDFDNGKIHYGKNSGANHDHREGISGLKRRSYMESKEKHKDSESMKQELESYMSSLSMDITDMINDATTEEKDMLRHKLTELSQRIN